VSLNKKKTPDELQMIPFWV